MALMGKSKLTLGVFNGLRGMGETYYRMFSGKNQRQRKGQYPFPSELHTRLLQSVLPASALFLTLFCVTLLSVWRCVEMTHQNTSSCSSWQVGKDQNLERHKLRPGDGVNGVMGLNMDPGQTRLI